VRPIAQLRAHSQQVAGLVSRRQEAPFVEVNSAGGGTAGESVKTVIIVSIATDHYVCKDFDDTGAAIGDPFDVWPRVFSAGKFITTGYNLTSTTNPVIMEKFNAGEYIDIWASPLVLRRAAGAAPAAKLYAAQVFHLSTCVA